MESKKNKIKDDAQITPSPLEADIETITSAYKDWKISVPRFYATNRPVMSSKLTSGLEATDKKLSGHLFLPVSRYSSLYYPTDVTHKYQGNFYFYESDSPYVLDLGKTAIFASKYDAVTSLSNYDQEILEWARLGIMNSNEWELAKKHILKNSTLDKKAAQDALNDTFDAFFTTLIPNETSIKEIPHLQTTPLFPTDASKLWHKYTIGIHDFLDLELYKLAIQQRIDTIVLQHEIGEYNSVTEILDTRPDSWKNVYKLPIELTPDIRSATDEYKEEKLQKTNKYSKVWFLDDGFLYNIRGSLTFAPYTSIYENIT
jgi:hypothetical protein